MTEEQLYQTVIEGTREAVIFVDRDGVIQFWNRGAEVVFGYAASEVLGKSLDVIIPERYRERHWEGYRKAMARGDTRYGHLPLKVPALRKDGAQISLEFKASMVKSPGNHLLGVVAIIRDATATWKEIKGLKDRIAALENCLAER